MTSVSNYEKYDFKQNCENPGISCKLNRSGECLCLGCYKLPLTKARGYSQFCLCRISGMFFKISKVTNMKKKSSDCGIKCT